jgi:hypothetical protein
MRVAMRSLDILLARFTHTRTSAITGSLRSRNNATTLDRSVREIPYFTNRKTIHKNPGVAIEARDVSIPRKSLFLPSDNR